MLTWSSTSEFGFAISSQIWKIWSPFKNHMDLIVLASGVCNMSWIHQTSHIKSQWFRQILLPAILVHIPLPFGSTTESASHHFCFLARMRRVLRTMFRNQNLTKNYWKHKFSKKVLTWSSTSNLWRHAQTCSSPEHGWVRSTLRHASCPPWRIHCPKFEY